MKPVLTLVGAMAVTLAAGCSSGDSDGGGPLAGSAACSTDGQKQFVLDTMRDVYFWNDDLPANVDLAQYATPEDLLAFLTSFQPLDSFSFINSAAADSAFFGEGQFVGFGFSYRFENDQALLRFAYDGSPAANAGFARGQEILAVDGATVVDLGASGLANAFGPAEEGVVRSFRMRRVDGSEYEVDVTKAVVTIDPIPQYRQIPTAGGTPVGYLEFSTFISTAEPQLAQAFGDFLSGGVNDLVLDLRYNGGGLVRIAELLGDYLGGDVANGLVFSKTLFNANNSGSNSQELFQRQNGSLSLSRLIVIASAGTASASELVINSLDPHVEVVIVGADTFGKPVGQSGIEFCEKILRPTTFETVNSLDEGRYFDGLPVDCPAADDLAEPVGAATDPALATALSYVENGVCPAPTLLQEKAQPVRIPEPAARPRSAAALYTDSV